MGCNTCPIFFLITTSRYHLSIFFLKDIQRTVNIACKLKSNMDVNETYWSPYMNLQALLVWNHVEQNYKKRENTSQYIKIFNICFILHVNTQHTHTHKCNHMDLSNLCLLRHSVHPNISRSLVPLLEIFGNTFAQSRWHCLDIGSDEASFGQRHSTSASGDGFCFEYVVADSIICKYHLPVSIITRDETCP